MQQFEDRLELAWHVVIGGPVCGILQLGGGGVAACGGEHGLEPVGVRPPVRLLVSVAHEGMRHHDGRLARPEARRHTHGQLVYLAPKATRMLRHPALDALFRARRPPLQPLELGVHKGVRASFRPLLPLAQRLALRHRPPARPLCPRPLCRRALRALRPRPRVHRYRRRYRRACLALGTRRALCLPGRRRVLDSFAHPAMLRGEEDDGADLAQ